MRIYYIITFMLNVFNIHGQNLKVQYDVKENISLLLKNIPSNMPPEQYRQLENHIRSMTSIYQLEIYEGYSVFNLEKVEYSPNVKNTFSLYDEDIKIYGDTIEIIRTEMNKTSSTFESISSSNQWSLINQDSTIQGYRCKKAINLQNNKIKAWYSVDIPINRGPYKYALLPGLIVYVEDGKRSYRMTKFQEY